MTGDSLNRDGVGCHTCDNGRTEGISCLWCMYQQWKPRHINS